MIWSLAVVFLLGFAPSPAADVSDPREVVQYPLDVAGATAARRGGAIVFTLETHAPFGDDALQQPEGEDYAVAIGVSNDRDQTFERLCYVHVRPNPIDGSHSAPYAVVTAGPEPPEADSSTFSARERIVGYATVERPFGYSVEVTIPARLLGPEPLEGFRWAARMVSSPEPGSIHYDYVPDGRLAREE